MPVSIIWRERNKEVNLELGEQFNFLALLLNINNSATNVAYELRILQGDGSIFKVFTSFFIFKDKLYVELGNFIETVPLVEGVVLESHKLGNFKHSHLIVTYRFV